MATSRGNRRNGTGTLRSAAGRVLIVGVEAGSLSAAERAWLRLLSPSGIILFRRNVEEPRQVHALLRDAEEAAASGTPLLRAMDVEGGTVDRLRDLIAPLPSAEAVASTGDPKLWMAHGRLAGREMRLLGLNVDFAPVLDLKTEASAPVMTSRVHSGDPDRVAAYAAHFLRGLREEDVLGCGKHFPGLGGGRVDSHHKTPAIEASFDELWGRDLLPYRKLARQLPLVMISHAAYPKTRSGAEPASVSRFWTTEVLFGKIGFRGLAISDDMEMGGILSQTGIGEACVRALLAGTRLVEICHSPALIFAGYEAILSEAERSPAFARRLVDAAGQVARFRRRQLQPLRFPKAPSAREIGQVRTAIQKFSASLAKRETLAQEKSSGQ